jgi:hypothetical protein
LIKTKEIILYTCKIFLLILKSYSCLLNCRFVLYKTKALPIQLYMSLPQISVPFGANTSTDDVMQWPGSTDRRRLSYTAKGVEIGLFKTGQVTDYYHSLLFFFQSCIHFLFPFTATRQTVQSDVSCSKFGNFTLQYSQVSRHPVIVLLCIIP